MKIFTKDFFMLSAIDQAAVVDAAIRELETGCFLNPQKAKQQIKRIEKKAVEYGVYKAD